MAESEVKETEEQKNNSEQEEQEIKDELKEKMKELDEQSEEDSQFAHLEQELVKIQEENTELTAERDRYETRAKRLQADFSNYKKRQSKQKDKLVIRAKKEMIEDLLPVIDNFERALASAEQDDDESELLTGVNMIYKQLDKFLAQQDVERIGELGEECNPEYHEAVLKEESKQYDSGEIIAVMQPGYRIGKEVIRPAMVKVAK